VQGLRWLRVTAYNAVAIALGVIAGLAVVAYAGGNVGVALSTLFVVPATTTYGIQQVFVRFVVFYTMAMGIGIALKAGLWNIGAQGQLVIGMVMVFVVYVYLSFIPWPIAYVLMFIFATLGGLLWIVVPTVLRVKFGANEIVVTLLLNVVATYFGTFMLNGPIKSPIAIGYAYTATLPNQFLIPNIVGNFPLTYAVPFTIIIGITLYYLVERTSFRVQANTVGENIQTAKYAGVNIPRVMTIVMLVAGALAGLAGATLQMGYYYHIDPGVFGQNWGFIAVIAALVGRKHMIGIGVSSLFFAYVTIGAEAMVSAVNVPTSIDFVMEAVMMVGILAGTYLAERRRA
jgi:simple sugar transport system permease protein